MATPRKDGRVLLVVAMLPEELEEFERYADFHGRSKSEQARRVLVAKLLSWRARSKRARVRRIAGKPEAQP